MITKYKDIDGHKIKVSTKVNSIFNVIENGINFFENILKIEENNNGIIKNYGSFKDEDTFHNELRGQLLADNLEIL